MLVVKTVRIPVHYGITRHKLSVLDSLTARTTYGAWLWSKLFKEHALKGSYKDRRLFYETVQKESALPAALVQCCFERRERLYSATRQQADRFRRRMCKEIPSSHRRARCCELLHWVGG